MIIFPKAQYPLNRGCVDSIDPEKLRMQQSHPSPSVNLAAYCQQTADLARDASTDLAQLPSPAKNQWLVASAQHLLRHSEKIIVANNCDLDHARNIGLSPATLDRLRLDTHRIQIIADAMLAIARLDDPIGQIIHSSVRPNGLKVEQVRVPLGVIFFIYESRPNVTADAAALCVKSGNAVILRGGKEALHSSRAIVDLLTEQVNACGIPAGAVQLVQTTDREAVGHFLRMSHCIDVAIPRGGRGLVERVCSEARMPVIKHFDGNCHVYVDAHADLEMAERIVINSKTQRMGVCNACESLLVHEQIAPLFLPRIALLLAEQQVEIRGDATVCRWIMNAQSANEDDWSTEYLGPIISIRVVGSPAEAIQHINRFGSHHTDAVVTDSLQVATEFTRQVDSAAVMVNASTRFNDGGELGLGAEIGISTDKLHARGPCGLQALTSYKYLVHGSGHIRQS